MRRMWTGSGILAMAMCVGLGTSYAASPAGEGDQKHQMQGQQQGQQLQQNQPSTGAQNTGADLSGDRDRHLGPQGGSSAGSQEGMRTGKDTRKSHDGDAAAHSTQKQGDEKITSQDQLGTGKRQTGEASGKMSQGQ